MGTVKFRRKPHAFSFCCLGVCGSTIGSPGKNFGLLLSLGAIRLFWWSIAFKPLRKQKCIADGFRQPTYFHYDSVIDWWGGNGWRLTKVLGLSHKIQAASLPVYLASHQRLSKFRKSRNNPDQLFLPPQYQLTFFTTPQKQFRVSLNVSKTSPMNRYRAVCSMPAFGFLTVLSTLLVIIRLRAASEIQLWHQQGKALTSASDKTRLTFRLSTISWRFSVSLLQHTTESFYMVQKSDPAGLCIKDTFLDRRLPVSHWLTGRTSSWASILRDFKHNRCSICNSTLQGSGRFAQVKIRQSFPAGVSVMEFNVDFFSLRQLCHSYLSFGLLKRCFLRQRSSIQKAVFLDLAAFTVTLPVWIFLMQIALAIRERNRRGIKRRRDSRPLSERRRGLSICLAIRRGACGIIMIRAV